MGVSVSEWMNEHTNEQTYKQMDEWMNERRTHIT